MEKTETPRTDALIKPDEHDMIVLFNEMLDHARQLERELRDAQACIRDAERWRYISGFLQLVVEEHSWDELVKQTETSKTFQTKSDWYWRVEFNDNDWMLGATVATREQVPASVDAAIDAAIESARQK